MQHNYSVSRHLKLVRKGKDCICKLYVTIEEMQSSEICLPDTERLSPVSMDETLKSFMVVYLIMLSDRTGLRLVKKTLQKTNFTGESVAMLPRCSGCLADVSLPLPGLLKIHT